MKDAPAGRKRARPGSRRAGRAPRNAEWRFATSPAQRGALVVAFSAIGLGLRLYRLGHDPLWFDEAYTALTARRSVSDILRLLRTEANAPLYYLLLHGWRAILGESDLRLRLLSAVTGAAIVPAMYVVGAAMFTPAAGLIAAAFAAVAPLHVHYSQELRMYGLVPVLALGTLAAFDRLVRKPDVRGAALLAGSLTAGLYLHYFFLFLVPLALATALSPTPQRALAYTASGLAVAGVAFLPWLATLLAQAGPNHTLDWIGAWWAKERSFWLAVPWSLETFGPAARYPPTWFKLGSSPLGGAISLIFALVAMVATVVRIIREPHLASRSALLLTLAAVLLPLLTAFVVSLIRAPIYVVARYDMIAWAPYCLLVSAVLAALPAAVSIPVAALWMALSIATLVPHFTTDRVVRVAAGYGHEFADMLRQRAEPGDLVIFTASTRPATEYYLGSAAGRFRMVSYPLGTDDHLGWIDLRIAREPAFVEQSARDFATWIATLDPMPRSLWLVQPGAAGNPALIADLQRLGYQVDPSRSDSYVLGFRKP